MVELEVTLWPQSYDIIRTAEMQCNSLYDWSALMDRYGCFTKDSIEDDSRSCVGCKSTFSV